MAKFVTTKYGTRINVDGLNPDQVKQVLSTAQDQGAYGAKGAALAKTFQQKNTKQPRTPNAPTPTNENGFQLPKGAMDPAGNFKDPNAVLGAIPDVPGAKDLQGDVTAARDAAYNYTTQNYAQDKKNEVEAARQDLANRGIPFDPTPGSQYQQTLANIDRKYQSMDDQAKNQAIEQGNTILGTESQVGATAADTFLKAVFGMSAADLQKLSIDKDTATKLAAIAKSRSGGGAPAQTPTTPIFAGDVQV